MIAIDPLHEPRGRALVATFGAWQLRQLAEHDRRLAYFASNGFAHVQLWHPEAHLSIITPSKLTGGQFELRTEDALFASPTWDPLEIELVLRGIAPPTRCELRAIERWFVLRGESRAGRLLRSWWAGSEEHMRYTTEES